MGSEAGRSWLCGVALALAALTGCTASSPESTVPSTAADSVTTSTSPNATGGSSSVPATVPTTAPPQLPTLEEVRTSVATVLPLSVQWRTELDPNCGPTDEVLPGLRFTGSARLARADDAGVRALADEAAAGGAQVMRSEQGVLTLRTQGWEAQILVDESTDPPAGTVAVSAVVDSEEIPVGFGRAGSFCG